MLPDPVAERADNLNSGPLNQVAPELWIIDGPTVPFLGLALPTRATIIRLADGGLWVHSPIQLSESLKTAVAELGEVQELIAPNKYHHLFLSEWIDAYPRARIHAAPGLPVKRRDLRFDGELAAGPSPRWAGQIDQVVFTGARAFDEVLFFHRPSATAILTDLIVNLPLCGQSWLGRIVARLDGVAYPNGSTPSLFRLGIRDRASAQATVNQLLAWRPRAAIIAHGEWFREDATAELRARFNWLIGP